MKWWQYVWEEKESGEIATKRWKKEVRERDLEREGVRERGSKREKELEREEFDR